MIEIAPSGHWPDVKTTGFGEFDHGEQEYRGPGPKEGRSVIRHTDPECPCFQLDEQSGELRTGAMLKPYEYKSQVVYSAGAGSTRQIHDSNSGGASRFFYCAKASTKEREEALEGFNKKHVSEAGRDITRLGADNPRNRGNILRHNIHPTVKPIKLMRYLVKLVTPNGGTVLDPFLGSGTSGIAACMENFDFIGIEIDPEYVAIAQARIAHWGDYEVSEGELVEKPKPEWL